MNARELHDAYERLAPQFGYETRADTKVFDPESPNGRLMQAAIDEVFGRAIALLAAVEESDGLVRELRDCRSIIGNLCAEGRPLSMSIPARPEVDEDLRMCATIDKAAARIVALEASISAERANGERERGMRDQHITRLETELASVKAERDALKAFRDYFTDKCEGLFFQFGMEVIDLYNATHGHKDCHIEPDRAAHPKDTP